MGRVADKIADAKQLQNVKPDQNDIVEQAGDLLGTIALAHDLPVDFDGVSISMLREPGTNRFMAVILSPVDMHAGEPFARYAVEPDHIAKPRAPKLVLPG